MIHHFSVGQSTVSSIVIRIRDGFWLRVLGNKTMHGQHGGVHNDLSTDLIGFMVLNSKMNF